MKVPVFSYMRLLFFLTSAISLAMLGALPFAAQQPNSNPFDETRIVAEMTNALQLQPEQSERLSELFGARRARIEGILRQMRQLQPGSPEFNQLRGEMDRERRSVLEALLPSLRPEQQGKLRGLINNPSPQQPNAPQSAIAPIKPILPLGALAAGERLISIPSINKARSRRSTDSLAPLSEEQKILHLLNRAGFGPRPGDVDRVRKLGIERYLQEQLHPEEMTDELLSRPLNSIGSLQMTTLEILQNYAPPPVPRPQPMPTPTPTPAPAVKPLSPPEQKGEASKAELSKAGSMEAPQPMQQSSPQSMAQEQKPQEQKPQEQKPQPTPAPVRPPVPARDGALPLRELQQAKMVRAVFSEKQLLEVMVDFWYNHFNVWANKDAARWMVTSYERDVIRPYALGKFKELLVATAQSPAMLYYLDNYLSQLEPSVKKDADGNPVPARRPGLNENYGRELMELHTLGVDGGYTQKDVTEVARCFTGWTIVPQPNTSFIFRPRLHDKGEKIVLGTRIQAGGGIEDGLRVLDILAKHPSTAKFISYKLCRRFVADEPPESLVDRVAENFRETDGDIREVVRTILTSPEFYSTKHYRNKIKSPFELAASAIRATGASTDGFSALIQTVSRMGEPLYLYQPPTGYSEESALWLSNATLLERMNFAIALANNRIAGTRVDVSRLVEPKAVNDPRRLLDQLVAALVHSDVSAETRENLRRVLEDSRAKAVPAKYDAKVMGKNNEQLVSGIAALVLGSREFQVK